MLNKTGTQTRAEAAAPSPTDDFWPANNLAEWALRPVETFDLWLNEQRVSGEHLKEGTTQKTYKAMFNVWVQYLASRHLNILEATVEDASDFFAGHTLEPVSRRRYLQLLDKVYDGLRRNAHWTQENPMNDELRLERELEAVLPMGLTPEQQSKLCLFLVGQPGWKGQRDRALAALALGAGLRTSEVIHAQYQDIKSGFRVHVRQVTIHRAHETIIFPDEHSRGWMTEWLDNYPKSWISDDGKPLIPSSSTGNRFSPSGVFRRVKGWLTECEIDAPQAGANILRNTFARNVLFSRRYSVDDLQEFLGHHDLRTTKKHELVVEQYEISHSFLSKI